jgi:hypothetical protein
MSIEREHQGTMKTKVSLGDLFASASDITTAFSKEPIISWRQFMEWIVRKVTFV